MSQYKTIFLIASPAMQKTPAFAYASHLAKTTGARLHICLFDYSEAIAAVGLVSKGAVELSKKAFIDQRRAWAETEALALREQGVHATGDAVWSRPMVEEILAQVAEVQPDIVIKDALHVPLLKRVFYTPVDWQLLRLCPAPLLLVNSAAHMLPRRIIAALDPVRSEPGDADFNKKIVHEALALSIQCDAELHLATACNPISAMSAGVADVGAFMNAELYEALRDAHQANFTAVADEFGVPADRRHFVLGSPPAAIAELAASCEADVIVVGTTYRKGLERMLFGSTAEGICEYAPCNVLAIKPEGFEKYFNAYVGGLR
jgi:universal stress protein E